MRNNDSGMKGIGGSLKKVVKQVEEIGAFGPAVNGFFNVDINESPEGEGIATWLAELYGAFALVNALLVSTAVQPFASLLGQADTALNYSFTYFWWTLSLIVNFMALYSSIFMLSTVLAMPKDANHLKTFVQHASKGFFKALALPAFFTVLGALVAIIAIFTTSWYTPLPWVFWLLFGLTCVFIALLIVCSRKADKARRQALGQD